MPDKYKATWVSYSSISTFQKCPRAYFLENVYKDPTTGNKITLMKPPLALGQAVHNVLESLAEYKTDERMDLPLLEKFDEEWKNYKGEQGGFSDKQEEEKYKKMGEDMLKQVKNEPGPLANLALKIDQDLPWFWLSEEEEIILCGKVDWLEYVEDDDSVHVIDFKTGKNKEDGGSLQLPIYHLLVDECQSREVSKMSYWYLRDSELEERDLPSLDEAKDIVMNAALEVKNARENKDFECPQGDNGCFHCKPFEKILSDGAHLVGKGDYGKDVYVLKE